MQYTSMIRVEPSIFQLITYFVLMSSNIMADISRDFREACDAVTDGLGPPTKTEYTIREVSILTGFSKQEVRNFMNSGKILVPQITIDGPPRGLFTQISMDISPPKLHESPSLYQPIKDRHKHLTTAWPLGT